MGECVLMLMYMCTQQPLPTKPLPPCPLLPPPHTQTHLGHYRLKQHIPRVVLQLGKRPHEVGYVLWLEILQGTLAVGNGSCEQGVTGPTGVVWGVCVGCVCVWGGLCDDFIPMCMWMHVVGRRWEIGNTQTHT